MHPKIYLLLRHNRQSGPYSLEELLQQAPGAHDLIWVEGRSAGWRYPSEIDSLKPYFNPDQSPSNAQGDLKPDGSVASQKKIHVALPGGHTAPPKPAPKAEANPLEQKAEAIRQRALAAQPPACLEPPEEPLQTRMSRNLSEVENDYTNWVFQAKATKKSQVNRRQLGLALLCLALLGGAIAWYSSETGSSASIKAPAQAAALPPVEEDTVSEAPLNETSIAAEETDPAVNLPEERATLQRVVEKSSPVNRKASSPRSGVVQTPVPQQQPSSPQRQEEMTTLPGSSEETSGPAVSPAPEKKKKKLGEKIDAFFEKLEGKKGKEETAQTESPSTQPSNGERTATRRGDETPVTAEDLKGQLQVTGSERNGDWMMGVHGLKLTLHNRSHESIRSAVVEVVYYSEQNEVLDKKRVSFGHIGPREKATASAPDHRLADHADYQVVSVTAKQDGTASH